MFVLTIRGRKDIIGIPEFCKSGAVEEDEMKEAKRNLLAAYSIYSEEIKDKFLAVITNQPELYENFDRTRTYGYGGEFYIALTMDYRSFEKQRPVETIDLNGIPETGNDKPATYNLVASRENTF